MPFLLFNPIGFFLEIQMQHRHDHIHSSQSIQRLYYNNWFGTLFWSFALDFLIEHRTFQQFAYNDKEAAFQWSWLSINANFYFSEHPDLVSWHKMFDQISKHCYRMHYFSGKPVFIHGTKQLRKKAKCGYDSSHYLLW